MPFSITRTSGGTDYGSPFVDIVGFPLSIPVDIDGLTANELDANGVVKPGVPLLRSGALVSGAGQVIFGCVIEATKVATDNSAAAKTAAGSPEIAVTTHCAVNRDILEDILGRALTANEIAAFSAAGSLIKLLD